MAPNRVVLGRWLGMTHRVGYDMCSVDLTIRIGVLYEAVIRRLETTNWADRRSYATLTENYGLESLTTPCYTDLSIRFERFDEAVLRRLEDMNSRSRQSYAPLLDHYTDFDLRDAIDLFAPQRYRRWLTTTSQILTSPQTRKTGTFLERSSK